jgi:GAF domain-containing protein
MTVAVESMSSRAKDLRLQRQVGQTSNKDLLEAMQEAASVFATAPDLPELFTKITEMVCLRFKASHAVLLLIDSRPGSSQEQDLVIQAEYLSNQESSREIALSKTIIQMVLETGESFYSPDARQDVRLTTQASIIALDLNAAAAVPLIGHSGVTGVLYVAALGQKESLLDGENYLPVLQAIANQVALYIESDKKRPQSDQAQRALPPLSEEELIAHSLAVLLKRLRQHWRLDPAEVEAKTFSIIDCQRLEIAESGGALVLNEMQLQLLADIYHISPGVLFAIIGQEFSGEILPLPSDVPDWLPEIFTEEVRHFMYRLWMLHDGKQVRYVLKIGHLAMDWLAEVSPK